MNGLSDRFAGPLEGSALPAAGPTAAGTESLPAAARGFDFLIGDWSVKHRRLKRRLAGSNDWEVFPGHLSVRPILHGLGNVDENVLEAPGERYLATSLRVFSLATNQWSVHWMDGSRSGIDKPVIGTFDGNIGRFYNEDQFEGRTILVRFTYRDLGLQAAAWDQAFSADEGKSWEVNWTMDFLRVDDGQ